MYGQKSLEKPMDDKIKKIHAIVGHDRYAIYEMLGHKISFIKSGGRCLSRPVSGVVKDVCRDIFTNEIVLTTLNGREHRFKEPVAIVRRGDSLTFLYGELDRGDLSDKDLFAALKGQFRETMKETISRMSPKKNALVRFEIGERVVKSPRSWRRA